MQEPVIYGIQIDYMRLLFQKVYERKEQETLEAIQVEVFRWPIWGEENYQVIIPESFK